MSVALGPMGRTGEASASLNTQGRAAAMYVSSLLFILADDEKGTLTPRPKASLVVYQLKDL